MRRLSLIVLSSVRNPEICDQRHELRSGGRVLFPLRGKRDVPLCSTPSSGRGCGGWAGPIAKMAEWMKHLRTEKSKEPLRLPSGGVFEPLTREVTQMARSISAAREAAEEEQRLRRTGESVWTPTPLKKQ